MLAKKGAALGRISCAGNYGIGHYGVCMGFSMDKKHVMRMSKESKRGKEVKSINNKYPEMNSEVSSCMVKVLLDCGSNFPMLPLGDLRDRFDVDLKYYAAQGTLNIQMASGQVQPSRFFEMFTSVWSDDGTPLVGSGDKAVWPSEPPLLGGYVPVWVNELKLDNIRYTDRLSGMMPFEACYMSSAPTKRTIWIGEDRRDVLGAGRMPPHLRYETDKAIAVEQPHPFAQLRKETKTPDEVIFLHYLKGSENEVLVDGDCPGVRGKSELAVLKHTYDEYGQRDGHVYGSGISSQQRSSFHNTIWAWEKNRARKSVNSIIYLMC